MGITDRGSRCHVLRHERAWKLWRPATMLEWGWEVEMKMCFTKSHLKRKAFFSDDIDKQK